ncbi:MAG: hypothetical protein R2698_10100 [Microthrixaceae bacterium]
MVIDDSPLCHDVDTPADLVDRPRPAGPHGAVPAPEPTADLGAEHR